MQQDQKKIQTSCGCVVSSNDQTNFLDCVVAYLLQIKDLSEGRLWFLCHQIVEINFDFTSVMIDHLLVLDQASQVLDVSL